MIRFLADEDFNNDIVRSLVRRLGRVDVVRVQDVDLRGASDDAVLEWAARARRLLLTHDVNTLLARAFDRSARGLGHAGVIAVAQSLPVAAVVEDLMLIAECLADDVAGPCRARPCHFLVSNLLAAIALAPISCCAESSCDYEK